MAHHAGFEKLPGDLVARVEFLVWCHNPILAAELAVCDYSHIVLSDLD